MAAPLQQPRVEGAGTRGRDEGHAALVSSRKRPRVVAETHDDSVAFARAASLRASDYGAWLSECKTRWRSLRNKLALVRNFVKLEANGDSLELGGILDPTGARTNLAGPNAMNGKKETVLDLGKFIDKGVRVKLSGGREVTGTLKGFDQLLNLVLDECVESLRDVNDPLKITDETRNLGLIVCRGTSVMVVSGLDGMEEIANPFLPSEEGGAVMAGGE